MSPLGTAVAAALATGLVGSLHCALMCGPLAASACARRTDAAGYFLGRFASYAAIGTLLGVVGERALRILPIATLHRLSLVFVIGFAAWRAAAVWLRRGGRERLVALRVRAPAPRPGRSLAHIPHRGLALGLVTGLLPCSMLLPAWALAMGSGGAVPGAVVMSAFAAASLPGLLAPLFASSLLRRRLRPPSPTLQAMAWAALAVWIAVRPLLMASHVHSG